MYFNNPEDLIRITPQWQGERFPDGRPKVPQSVLDRIRRLNFEEAWASLARAGYNHNTESNFRILHPERKMVGRAVTAVMVPHRPDLDAALRAVGDEEGHTGFYNQWIIDSLVEDDVVIVDLYDKIYRGTYVGGNLSTAIATRTKRGGAVIWGGIRDLEQIVEIKNEYLNVYYRGVHPTGIGECVMTGFNAPCRVGEAICMPGDVVLGTLSGVVFIPPHMAEDVATNAEKLKIRDVFGFQRLQEGVYTTAQVDRKWTPEMNRDFLQWFATDPRAADFQHLNWDEEMADHEGN
ncbi:MAG: RraA family protein [Bacillota bacterium]|nr:RraA family protein [Bacillota bacterium]